MPARVVRVAAPYGERGAGTQSGISGRAQLRHAACVHPPLAHPRLTLGAARSRDQRWSASPLLGRELRGQARRQNGAPRCCLVPTHSMLEQIHESSGPGGPAGLPPAPGKADDGLAASVHKGTIVLLLVSGRALSAMTSERRGLTRAYAWDSTAEDDKHGGKGGGGRGGASTHLSHIGGTLCGSHSSRCCSCHAA